MNDIDKAKKRLEENKNYSCVVLREEHEIISEKRGVSPLLDLVDHGLEFGYSAADRIVGKAAALLYVLLKVDCVYGEVMSKSAAVVLKEHGISFEFGVLTDKIVNRTNTGECPMEIAVRGITNPHEAYVAIKNTVEKLKSK